MTPKKKLALRTETLRVLSPERLVQVMGGGGGGGKSDACTEVCTGACSDTCADTVITKSGKAAGCVNSGGASC